jgi:hypothetical protein
MALAPNQAVDLAMRAARRGRAEGGEADPNAPGGITAYHGGPHDFDQFDIGKVGTGEGATAYGHGLYFAEHPEVAHDYRHRLSGAPNRGQVFFDNRPLTDPMGAPGEAWLDRTLTDPETGVHPRDVWHDFQRNYGRHGGALAALQEEAAWSRERAGEPVTRESNPKASESGRAALATLKNDRADSAEAAVRWFEKHGHRLSGNFPGHAYKVRIKAEPEHFLDWDKRVDAQHPVVQKALRAALPALFDREEPGKMWSTDDGEAAYRKLTAAHGGRQAASEALLAQGVPGIRYFDQGSRAGASGTRNYVTFHHDPVEVEEKYAGGGAVAAAMRAAGGRIALATGGARTEKSDPGTPEKAAVFHKAFKGLTGRAHGSDPADLPLVGRGDVTMPPGMKPKHFSSEVARLVQGVKDWNTPQRRYWYENSGHAIGTSTGWDPEMADRLTYGIAKTSPQTPVLANAMYAATAHHQAALGEPVRAGMFPNNMGPAIEQAYRETTPGAVGPKISGYQSGFRTAWRPDVLNEGANDIHNMRELGWKGWSEAATTGQHNYDRFMRSAVTDVLNKQGHDGGKWLPGQVQAVLWAKSRAAGGVPEGEAGYDITHGFRDRAARGTYESAPGVTTGHFPEYHDAPFEVKQRYHNDINDVLQDEHGRDRISHAMGLLTLPTEHGVGVFQGRASPGSAARVVAGGAGGWQKGVDPATRKLMSAAEMTRALLLKQDAAAWHFPQYPKSGMNWNTRNMFDVNLGRPINHDEAHKIADTMQRQTGTDFFSPIHTPTGYRFINVPEVSGVQNKDMPGHLRALAPLHEDATVGMGNADSFYHASDWKQDNGQAYVQGLRALGPDISGRAQHILSTLGPRVAAVDARYAKEQGWTPRKEASPQVAEPTPPKEPSGEGFASGGEVEGRRDTPIDPDAEMARVYADKTEQVPLDWLEKLPGNELRHGDDYINAMANQLKTKGAWDPAIIAAGKHSRTAQLSEGNHRIAAARRAGFTHFPARVITGGEWGKGKPGSDYHDDLIPQPDEYFSADARPSQVFRSLAPGKAAGGPVDPDLTAAQQQGADTSSIPAIREAGKLASFHKGLMAQVNERAQASAMRARDYHEQGLLPFPVGTRFTTPHTVRNGLSPYTVTHHVADARDPQRYGYGATRGTPDSDDYERTNLMVSDPAADQRLAKLGSDYDRAADVAQWKPFGGLTVAKARGGRAEGGPLLFHSNLHGGEHPPSPHGGGRVHRMHVGPIHSPVAGRTDHLPMHVPSGSYVLPADVVSSHGEGNTSAGFKVMRRLFGGAPYGHKGGPYGQSGAPYNQTGGPYGQSSGPYGEPLQNQSRGGRATDGERDKGVPIVAAGGEYVLSPDQVRAAGKGDPDLGCRVLDEFVKRSRAKHIKTLRGLPGPAKD